MPMLASALSADSTMVLLALVPVAVLDFLREDRPVIRKCILAHPASHSSQKGTQAACDESTDED